MDNITLVIYDITDDALRNKVSQFLKRFGLKRIQKSAFAGKITSSQRSEVISGLRRLVKEEKVNIQIYTITEAIFRNREVIGVEISYDEENVVVS